MSEIKKRSPAAASPSSTEDSPEERHHRDIGRQALIVLAYGMACGGIVVVLYAFATKGLAEFFSVVGVAAMIGGASLLVGGILGFLFGIPRTLQEPGAGVDLSRNAPDEAGGTPDAAPTLTRQYAVNTNLEQISDWLTKMLVGVGLTQLYKVPGLIGGLGGVIAPGLGDDAGAKTFGIAIFIFFMVAGFLFGYLWARLFLLGAFRQADLRSLGAEARKTRENLVKAEARITEIESRERLDARALSLVTRQLNTSPDVPPVDQEQLNEAVRDASAMARAQVFNEAWKVRSENWSDEASKEKMERTIPVFRALIANDPGDEYHMNHGQLGFALKDQREPDWEGARSSLTRAIEIRGSWPGATRWLYYEFNRAIAIIELDPSFREGKPSSPETKQQIFDDLVAAWSAPDIHETFKKDPVQSWMRLNKVTRQMLGREMNKRQRKLEESG